MPLTDKFQLNFSYTSFSLRIDKKTVARARLVCKAKGTNLSRMVSDYISILSGKFDEKTDLDFLREENAKPINNQQA